MLRKSVTQQYPEVKPALPPRSRGVIALVEENCTSCMLCARECPDWCIYIDSHKETLPAPEGGRPRQRNVLDRFAIDFSLCMYCGICIEVCPFDALFWSPEFEYAEGDIRNLLHEKDRLAAWVPTVPPPPAHDPGAEPPKELAAAPRRPAGPRAGGTPGRPPARPDAGTDAPPVPPSTGDVRARTSSGEDASARPASARPAPARPASAQDASTTGSPDARSPQDPRSAPEEPHPAPDARPPAPPVRRSAGEPDAPEAAPGPRPSDPTTQDAHGTRAADRSATGPDRPGPSERRARMANIRGIRPPGSLPAPPPAGDKPGTTPPASEGRHPKTPETDTRSPEPPQHGVSPEAPSPAPAPDDADSAPREAASASSEAASASSEAGSESSEAGAESAGELSTGSTSGEESSTASGEPRPNPEAEEQTSAPRPRRRRMADPRSIRPPGRLDPADPREPEEE
ncbi:4Fe-4S binding protein [Nonomuraea sp. NPDC050383]|uniref:4Fe-4S binding protein n=1 Tax=Nonomuraea sp. NPDC050383 TaxID=3364362 RepID=UPI0037A8E147